MELNILLAVLSAAVAAVTFFIGRQTAANSSGREWGELLADVRFIKESMGEMKSNQSAEVQALRAEIAAERSERVTLVQRLHDKLEEHILEGQGGHT